MTTKRNPEEKERHREHMRRIAARLRENADEVCALWDCDDPLHPPLPLDPQPFRDWLDFVDKVARPLVEANGDFDAEQAAMKLYRKASPYFLCAALVMAANQERCQCGHPAADHFRGHANCMASTATERWACDCAEFVR